ncbi:MAG: endo-1,4-beta-xylanase [Christensenellales bacterium]
MIYPPMDATLVRQARERIEKVRRKDLRVTVTRNGQPVEGAQVSLRMKKHQYLFGAVCYAYGVFKDPAMNERFTQLFTPLLNYTMMPVHWDWYEPKRHQYNEPYVGNLVDWAQQHDIKRKMHALIWHECCPEWVENDADIQALYVERITQLMTRYRGRFDFYDIINETTVNDRFDNPVSRWVRSYGPWQVAKFGVDLARSIQPDARLIYGDWNVHGQDYLDFLRELREHDVNIDLLGLQSHMHRDGWTAQETLRVIDEAARFRWPIHFPEVSICSGKPIGEMSYLRGGVNHFSETEEDLYWQADFTRDFYTLVFSHPATEAISWFDFVDHRWLGAPAGLVTDDLQIKPVYRALQSLIHGDWHTDADLVTGTSGATGASLFFGSYGVTVQKDGQIVRRDCELVRPSFYEGGAGEALLHIDLDRQATAT